MEIDLFAIEEQYIGKNKKSGLIIAQTTGMLAYMAYEIFGKKPILITPSQWMNLLGLRTIKKGVERSSEMAQIIKREFKHSSKSEDELCAIGIANYL